LLAELLLENISFAKKIMHHISTADKITESDLLKTLDQRDAKLFLDIFMKWALYTGVLKYDEKGYICKNDME